MPMPTTDFNPRSREGSDRKYCDSLGIQRISIHAPAKGATGHPLQRVNIQTISIHAPAKGATVDVGDYVISHEISIHAPAKGATTTTKIFLMIHRFQSTLPRRERPFCNYILAHAYNFNPRSREGSDTDGSNRCCKRCISIHAPAKGATTQNLTRHLSRLFQSTLPRRERQFVN